jgi:nucleotide-binding universal stress UspA family protein
MFHKLLVAIDISESSRNIFEEALVLAKTAGSSLMLLHVLSYEEEASSSTPIVGLEYNAAVADDIVRIYQKRREDYENRSLEILQNYVKQAAAVGVPAEFTQDSGRPEQMICEFASSWGADLIIIGRRGYSGLSELLLGSISNYVIHQAPCSVLIIQGTIPANPATAQDQRVEMPLQATDAG